MGWREDLYLARHPQPEKCDGSRQPGQVIGRRTDDGTLVMCNWCNGRFRSPDGRVPEHPESAAWPNGKDEYGRPL